MFTGIIVGKAKIFKVSKNETDLVLKTKLSNFGSVQINIGDSIALDGVCLTVEKIDQEQYAYFHLMNETLIRTTFGQFPIEKEVNFELSLLPSQRLDGHVVYGEIDCFAKISSVRHVGESIIYGFDYPSEYAKLVVTKGRIAIDGASLSIINADLKDGYFEVSLIPHSLKVLTISNKKVNDIVNLEFDIYAKIITK